MRNSRFIHNTIRWCMAGALSASLICGGFAAGAVSASEWSVSEADLFPDRLTVENPGMLGDVPLPASPYGILSWSDATFVLTSYSQSCQIKLTPGSGLDLSYMNGYRPDSGAVFGSVTVVVSSLAPAEEAGQSEDQAGDQTGETDIPPAEEISAQESEASEEAESEEADAEETVQEPEEAVSEEASQEPEETQAEEASQEHEESEAEEPDQELDAEGLWTLPAASETAEVNADGIEEAESTGEETGDEGEADTAAETPEEETPEAGESPEVSEAAPAEESPETSETAEENTEESAASAESADTVEESFEAGLEEMSISESIEIPNLADTPDLSGAESQTASSEESPEAAGDPEVKAEDQVEEASEEPVAEDVEKESGKDEEAAVSGGIWDVSAVETTVDYQSKASSLLEDDPMFVKDTEEEEKTETPQTSASKAPSLIGNSILEEAEDDELIDAQPAVTRTPVQVRTATPTPVVNYGSASNTSAGYSNTQNSTVQTAAGNNGAGTDVESLSAKGSAPSYDYYGRPAVFTGDETNIAGTLLTAAGALAAILLSVLLRKKQKES